MESTPELVACAVAEERRRIFGLVEDIQNTLTREAKERSHWLGGDEYNAGRRDGVKALYAAIKTLPQVSILDLVTTAKH
jgi:hypothetical protein